MNEADFSRAVSRFLESELSPSEAEELLKAIEADPQLRESFISHVRLSVRLQASCHPAHDRRLVERTKALLGARDPGQPLRTLEAVQRRIRSRNRTGRWIWATIAAAGLLVTALYATRPSAPRPEVEVYRPPLVEATPPVEPPRPPAPTPVTPAPVEPPKETPVEKPAPEPPPAPRVEPVPPPPTPRPEPRPTPVVETKVVVAKVESLSGEAQLWTPSGRKPVRAGQDLFEGEGVQTGAGGKAAIVFADRTRLDAGANTLLRGIVGKKLHLDRGSLRAQVTKQPADQAIEMITPHAEAKIVGTVLRLDVGVATRLDVTEGKVQLKRTGDAKAIDVGAGEYAVAAPGLDLVSYPNPLVIDLDEFGTGRDCKPAESAVKKLYRDESLGATGGTCIVAPGVGTSLDGALPLAPGAWHLWIRYRDNDQGPISFQVYVDGRISATIVGEGLLNKPGWVKWNWRRVSFDHKAKPVRLTLRSTSDASGWEKNDNNWVVANRWDLFVLTRDPSFDPLKDLR